MKESVPYFNTRDLLSEVLESAIGLKQYLFMINIQVYNYYNTWLEAFDNKIENLILSHLLITITLFTMFDVDKMT